MQYNQQPHNCLGNYILLTPPPTSYYCEFSHLKNVYKSCFGIDSACGEYQQQPSWLQQRHTRGQCVYSEGGVVVWVFEYIKTPPPHPKKE